MTTGSEHTRPSTDKFLDSYMNSKDRLRILERAVESARNGVVITDPNLKDNPIVYANKAFMDLTGYELQDILGKNCRFLQGDDRQQEGVTEVRNTLATGQACLVMLRNYRKDGTLFWNELSISPVHDDSGKLIFFVGIQNDVSARKEAEKRVSEFYSMISHELRTPLSSIRASMGLIDDGEAGEVAPQAARLVNISLRNAERLLKLVDEVLDLKKIESGKLTLSFDMLEPTPLIRELISDLNNLATAKEIHLIAEFKTSKHFCADVARLTQILTNLIGNAIKYSFAGSTVTVRIERIDAVMRFSVIDAGPGIKPEDIPKLFSKFQQIDSSETRPHAGTGLGLYISKQLVELHGGEIGVSSQLGEGCTFWFTIPVVPVGTSVG